MSANFVGLVFEQKNRLDVSKEFWHSFKVYMLFRRMAFQAIWLQCYSFGRIYVIEWWRVGRNEAWLGPKEATLARGGPPLGKDRISGQHLAEYLKTSLEKAQNIRQCSENFRRGLAVLVGFIVKLSPWANLPWGGKSVENRYSLENQFTDHVFASSISSRMYADQGWLCGLKFAA